MFAFRISQKKYINDLSGEGARLYGGRWNLKGIPLVYLAESPSLALVEYLVHIPLGAIPNDTCFAVVNLPDQQIIKLKIKDLPDSWADFPAPEKIAQIGTDWALSQKSLSMKVPSAVNIEDFNILLNPLHPDIDKVQIQDVRPYKINSRLFREGL